MKSLSIQLPNGIHFSHLLDPVHERAILAAAAANRPLLVRGEPGLGKSQLAYAAASLLGRKLISYTIHANTEAQDLLWSFDAVKRLAESQVASHTLQLPGSTLTPEQAEQILREKIAVKNFVLPGPLWWAIDWESAAKANQEREAPEPIAVSESAKKDWNPEHGIVILIDEIDKAESSVPNGLLEVFGARQLQPPGWSEPIVSQTNTKSPLVIITTNEERMLPTAFIRRCFVLEMKLLPCVDAQGSPVRDEAKDKFLDYFVELGTAHFDEALPASLYKEVAEMLFEDRCEAIRSQAIWKPGPAEYVDLLCAVKEWQDSSEIVANASEASQSARTASSKKKKKSDKDLVELCKSLRQFTLRKNVNTK